MNITTIRNEEKKTHSDAHMQACTDARIILKQFLKIIPVDIIKWLSSSSHPFIHSFFVCVCACIVCKLNASVCECVCMSTLSEKKNTSNSSKANRIEIKQRYLCEPAEWERRKQDQTVLCTVRPLFVLSSIYVYSLCALSLVFFILLLFFIIIFKKKEKSVHVRYWILRSVLIFDGGGERESDDRSRENVCSNLNRKWHIKTSTQQNPFTSHAVDGHLPFRCVRLFVCLFILRSF